MQLPTFIRTKSLLIAAEKPSFNDTDNLCTVSCIFTHLLCYFQLYCSGKLLFADHIFNGYGNAKNDFRKQLYRSKQEALLGHFLPDDFRFDNLARYLCLTDRESFKSYGTCHSAYWKLATIQRYTDIHGQKRGFSRLTFPWLVFYLFLCS